jgi:hypothetical protein
LDILEDGTATTEAVRSCDGHHVPFRFPSERQKCFHFCRNQKLIVEYRPKQGFDAESVSGGHYLSAAVVVNDKGELAAHMIKESWRSIYYVSVI